MEQIIREQFMAVLAEQGLRLKSELGPETVLLESGLDSLGFAILVARLEETLGCDPFAQAQQAFYPRTYREFVEIYQQFVPPQTKG